MTQITLLDGGLGQELIHRAGDRPTPLWSTQVMVDHPGLVKEVHCDFLRAGATIIASNTYPLHRDRLIAAGCEDRFEDLHDLALKEAEAAKAAHPGARILGSIGPLGASYRAEVHPDFETAVPLYAEIARLMKGRVDLVGCETVVSLLHSRSILEGAKAAGVPVWIAFSVDDEDGSKLRSGEALAQAVELAVQMDAKAVLANCSAPEVMAEAVEILKTSDLPCGAYANGFAQITKDFLKANPTVDALSKRRDFTPEVYADHVMSWVDQGARIVGGCCEVSPAHIAEIARRLRAAGHTIV